VLAQIVVPLPHQLRESLLISGANHRKQALDRQKQRGQRFGAVVVQGLDFEIQVGIFGRDESGQLELGVERRAGNCRQAGSRLAALH
jgi:hypothetical protein